MEGVTVAGARAFGGDGLQKLGWFGISILWSETAGGPLKGKKAESSLVESNWLNGEGGPSVWAFMLNYLGMRGDTRHLCLSLIQ